MPSQHRSNRLSLATLWFATAAASASLFAVGFATSPNGWDIALSFEQPFGLRSGWIMLQQAFRTRPLEATAIIALPALALTITLRSLAVAAAQKMSAPKTSEYLTAPTRRGSRHKFQRVLKKIRDTPPIPGDRE